MITKKMIQDGYHKGLINVVDSPFEDGAVCKIGEYWFYFGGHTAADLTAEEYVQFVPEEDIINEIYDVLCEFLHDDAFIDEYNYYESYLNTGCRHGLRICSHCLSGIESREGKLFVREVDLEDKEENPYCDWCGEEVDQLFEIMPE